MERKKRRKRRRAWREIEEREREREGERERERRQAALSTVGYASIDMLSSSVFRLSWVGLRFRGHGLWEDLTPREGVCWAMLDYLNSDKCVLCVSTIGLKGLATQ